MMTYEDGIEYATDYELSLEQLADMYLVPGSGNIIVFCSIENCSEISQTEQFLLLYSEYGIVHRKIKLHIIPASRIIGNEYHRQYPIPSTLLNTILLSTRQARDKHRVSVLNEVFLDHTNDNRSIYKFAIVSIQGNVLFHPTKVIACCSIESITQ